MRIRALITLAALWSGFFYYVNTMVSKKSTSLKKLESIKTDAWCK